MHKSAPQPLPLKEAAIEPCALVDDDLVGPEMTLAAHGTSVVTPVALVHVVAAGAGGVQAMDHVGGVNIGEPLRRYNLEINTPGAAEMILKVPLPALPDMNEGDLVSSEIFAIIAVFSISAFPLT